MLENLNYWATQLGPASRRSRGLFFVLERFHLNHRAAFSDTNNNEIINLEKQLAALGAKCILLTISPEVAEERIKSREPEKWINKTDEEVKSSVQQLLETQSILRQQAKLSEVPTIEINTDKKEWDNYAKLILEDDNFSGKI